MKNSTQSSVGVWGFAAHRCKFSSASSKVINCTTTACIKSVRIDGLNEESGSATVRTKISQTTWLNSTTVWKEICKKIKVRLWNIFIESVHTCMANRKTNASSSPIRVNYFHVFSIGRCQTSIWILNSEKWASGILIKEFWMIWQKLGCSTCSRKWI